MSMLYALGCPNRTAVFTPMLARAANGGEAQEYLMGVTAANMLAMGKQILKRVARERERARERG